MIDAVHGTVTTVYTSMDTCNREPQMDVDKVFDVNDNGMMCSLDRREEKQKDDIHSKPPPVFISTTT